MIFITNLERLKLELGNRQYLEDHEFSILLQENNLFPTEIYVQTSKKAILHTVLDVLNILANDIDNFRKLNTEFTTTTEAFSALSKRMIQVKNAIKSVDNVGTSKVDETTSFMFFGGG